MDRLVTPSAPSRHHLPRRAEFSRSGAPTNTHVLGKRPWPYGHGYLGITNWALSGSRAVLISELDVERSHTRRGRGVLIVVDDDEHTFNLK